MAQKIHGFDLDVSESSSGDMSLIMKDYTETKEYDLIILLAYHALDAANEMETLYPKQKYMVYDIASEGNPNMVTESFAKNELGFAAGAFIALMEAKGSLTLNGATSTWAPNNKFGMVTAVELTSTVGAATGFEACVKYINPNAEFQRAATGSWSDQAKA